MMISTPHYNKMGMPTESFHVDFLKSIEHEARERQLRLHDEHDHDSNLHDQKEQEQELQEQLLQKQLEKHKMLMNEIRHVATFRNALRDYKIKVVLQELIHMTSVFGTLCPSSRRRALMREIHHVGKSRAMARENHQFNHTMEQPQQQQKQQYSQEQVLQRRALMNEIHKYTFSRNLEKDMKRHMLLELHHQKAFRFPSIRKRLLSEIRVYGTVRAQVKDNHKRVMMELKESFGQKTRQRQMEKRKELMMELHTYTSTRNVNREMKRQLMEELHKQVSQRDVTKDFHANLLRDLKIMYAFKKLMKRGYNNGVGVGSGDVGHKNNKNQSSFHTMIHKNNESSSSPTKSIMVSEAA